LRKIELEARRWIATAQLALSLGRPLELLNGVTGASLQEREQALGGYLRRLCICRKVRGLSNRLGRPSEKLRLAGC